MPDPLKQTVSASQVGALFNLSPYATRFTLWHWFKSGVGETAENRRMTFGKFVEPFILDQVQERLRLEVTHNAAREYVRRAPIGCTRDATVYDPARGLGIVQAKAVSYMSWKENWTEAMAPKWVELQAQTEMLATGASWGVIAAMIGQNDNLLLYERTPSEALVSRINGEAQAFLASLEAEDAPDALGSETEIPVLAALYPATVERKVLTLTDTSLGEDARLYRWAAAERAAMERVEKDKKAKLLAAAGDAETLILPGAEIRIKRSQTKPSIISLPAEIAIPLRGLNSAHASEIDKALAWQHQAKAGGVRTTLDVTETAAPDFLDEVKELTP
jgi:hypothetical protein